MNKKIRHFHISQIIYKNILFSGGLAEEVDEKILNAAFIPFGEIVDVQIPLDYESEKHRGFAFIEFELAEDALAAIDNMVIINIKKLIYQLNFYLFYFFLPTSKEYFYYLLFFSE